MKVPTVVRDNYVMYLEFFDGVLWFHTDVKNWSATIKTKFLEDLNLLQYLTSVPVFALIEEDNKKLQKFATLIDFKQIQPYVGQDNKMYYIYSRSL